MHQHMHTTADCSWPKMSETMWVWDTGSLWVIKIIRLGPMASILTSCPESAGTVLFIIISPTMALPQDQCHGGMLCWMVLPPYTCVTARTWSAWPMTCALYISPLYSFNAWDLCPSIAKCVLPTEWKIYKGWERWDVRCCAVVSVQTLFVHPNISRYS